MATAWAQSRLPARKPSVHVDDKLAKQSLSARGRLTNGDRPRRTEMAELVNTGSMETASLSECLRERMHTVWLTVQEGLIGTPEVANGLVDGGAPAWVNGRCRYSLQREYQRWSYAKRNHPNRQRKINLWKSFLIRETYPGVNTCQSPRRGRRGTRRWYVKKRCVKIFHIFENYNRSNKS